MPEPKFDIKGLKTFKAHEGMPGYSCTLIINGKKACEVFEDCMGGGLQYTWIDVSLEPILKEAAAKLPPYPAKDGMPEIRRDADSLIEDLVNDILEKKEDAKMAKKWSTQIMFKVPEQHRNGQYGIWKVPPTAEWKKKLKDKHPSAIFLDEHPNDWREIVCPKPKQSPQ